MSLFDSPVEWSGHIVKSRVHFAFYTLIFSATIAMLVYMASAGGWRSAIGFGVFIVGNQILILYAMRKMYLKLIKQAKPDLGDIADAGSAEPNSFSVKTAWSLASDVVLCWLPFVAASYLCNIAFDRADQFMRTWEPAFYSFLPMVFFFAGAVAFLSRREIRELRTKVNGLRPDLREL